VEVTMKKIAVLSLVLVAALALSAAFVSAQGPAKYHSHGISFNYSAGSIIEDESQPGKYDIVHCTSAAGDFFSLTVFREDASVDFILDTYKAEFEGQFRKRGATDLKFSDIEETMKGKMIKGWLLTFTLNGVAFENRTFATTLNGNPVCFTRQFPTINASKAARFFEPIFMTLTVRHP
jgi:hypothetical protein